MTRIGLSVFCLLVAATNTSSLVVKRDTGSKSQSNFVPSQPLHPGDFVEGVDTSETISNKIPPEISSRSSDSKAPGKEDPHGNMYYYYYPSGGSEDRDGSSATSGGAYNALEPADSAASSSSSTSSGSSYGGYSGGTSGGSYGYGGGAVASGGKDTSHFVKIAIPLFLIGALLLGYSSLIYPTRRSLDSMPFSFLQMWEAELERIFDNYLNALQTEHCLQRTVCEAGHFAKDYSATKYFLPLFEMFSPEIMKNNAKVFKSAIQDKKDISSCKKYTCHYGKKRQ